MKNKEAWIRKKILLTQNNPPIILSSNGINSEESLNVLRQKVKYFALKMDLTYSELKLRKMKNRWGSCTQSKIITLNKKLSRVPEICIDYVVIHELAHLVHMNHSKKFHALVAQYTSHSKEAKEILSKIIFE